MDKEAKDKIALLIYQESRVYPDGGKSGRIAEEVLNIIEQLGYRKPKGRPPLLSDERIKNIILNYYSPETTSADIAIYSWDYEIAQAQREADIQWITD